MIPVVTYQEFLDYLKNNPCNNTVIPILLLPPDDLDRNLEKLALDKILQLYHHRTGEKMVFFLPGYVHYPKGEDGFFGGNWVNHETKCFDYTIGREPQNRKTVRIFYCEEAYAQFVEELYESTNGEVDNFATELLLAKLCKSDSCSCPDIDFSSIRRYDLSYLYMSSPGKIYAVKWFLDVVFRLLHPCGYTEEADQTLRKIDTEYDIAFHL